VGVGERSGLIAIGVPLSLEPQVGHAGERTRGQSSSDRSLRLIVHPVDDRVEAGESRWSRGSWRQRRLRSNSVSDFLRQTRSENHDKRGSCFRRLEQTPNGSSADFLSRLPFKKWHRRKLGPLQLRRQHRHAQLTFVQTFCPQREFVGVAPAGISRIERAYLTLTSVFGFSEALAAILGERASGLSAANIVRLKVGWEADYATPR
jgi:hypothetical protein